LPVELLRGRVQQRRQRQGRGARVPDVVRDRIDGGRFHRHRELATLTVENRSALSGDLDAPLRLALRPGAIARALGDLDLHEAADEDGSPDQEEKGEEARAASLDAVHRVDPPGASTNWT